MQRWGALLPEMHRLGHKALEHLEVVKKILVSSEMAVLDVKI
jgi:hypothetical protein